MAESESEIPMTKMYVIFESEFPTDQVPAMRERIERLGANLTRIALTNEQLSIFDFERIDSGEDQRESDWVTLEQWTNNYLINFLQVHPTDRPGTWPTSAWNKLANMIDPSYVAILNNKEVRLHKDGLFSFAESLKHGKDRRFTGQKSRELLFMFLRNHPKSTQEEPAR